MSLAWQVEELEDEVDDLRARLEEIGDGEHGSAIGDWKRVHPEIRREAIKSIDSGDPVSGRDDSRKKARAALVALLEALED